MAINLVKDFSSRVRIYPLNTASRESKFCIYCVEPVEAFCLIGRKDYRGNKVLDYCCVMCASGWLEIGDRFNLDVV